MTPRVASDTAAALGARNQHFHFDEAYRSIDVDELVELIGQGRGNRESVAAHLRELASIHASWHGLYFDSFAERLPGAKVLELGSGDGTNACLMAALGAEVIASDISRESGRIIRDVVARTGLRHLRFEASDTVMETVRPRSLDFVVGKALQVAGLAGGVGAEIVLLFGFLGESCAAALGFLFLSHVTS